MRVIALVASYNEERFIRPCISHLARHGVETYLLDNGSTDRTVEMAESLRGRGLIGLEHVERGSCYRWKAILQRKEELAQTLEADWFIHLDPDEVRLPPRKGVTMAEAFAEVEEQGCNAINFMEFSFIPTRESPDHNHADFQRTMKSYYPFLPSFPHRLNAWKKQSTCVDLASSGGHKIIFPELRMYPESFPMRHYLFLSIPHAIEKYVGKSFDPVEIKAGWHGWRSGLTAEMLELPNERDLRKYLGDNRLDVSNPRKRHHIAELWEAVRAAKKG